ncbi:methionine/alanine import family NSS transporter small subunit [Rothia sp. (in: high G+C Gram-positive bacteria)]|uniref:methionine/alanine import family NSS transporter small subunit n=1 Tax=Rothia sp. (in: high G+C Gram-positive bacteria) TaxID=1885016 RepID=UPI000EC8D7BC|nr:putative methionine/alanine importer small subunit [Rothia sp. (in: high G+C Gram-positive bacteria)]
MSTPAIIMLFISIALIWGGLGAALVHISRHPDEAGSEANDGSEAPEPAQV